MDTVRGINPEFVFVANLVLSQRRVVWEISEAMNRDKVNGIILAGSFLQGVGQFATIHCNYDGKIAIEKYLRSTVTWEIRLKE